MAIGFSINISKAMGALNAEVARMGVAAERGVARAAHDIEAEAKRNSTGPARWRKGVNHPREGGPGVVTGAHRRGIVVQGPMRVGEGTYTALVGPTMVYSRALEKGHPRWRRRGGYPYMEPAYTALRGGLGRRIADEWARAARRP